MGIKIWPADTLCVRNATPAIRPRMDETVTRLACEMRDEIAEIDVNPVLVDENGAVAVDALILRKYPETPC